MGVAVKAKKLTMVGTYAYTAQDFRETARALFEGRLGHLNWFETRPLGERLVAVMSEVMTRLEEGAPADGMRALLAPPMEQALQP